MLFLFLNQNISAQQAQAEHRSAEEFNMLLNSSTVCSAQKVSGLAAHKALKKIKTF